MRSAGRLGNQLFQLAFALTRRTPSQKLYLYNFNDVFELLDTAELTALRITPRSRIHHFFYNRLIFPFLSLSAHCRVISRIAQAGRTRHSEPALAHFTQTHGLLPILLFEKDYYQSEQFCDPEQLLRYPIKKTHQERAQTLLAKHCPPTHTPIAVHVRRGDYLQTQFQNNDQVSALPIDYYWTAIAKIRAHIDKPWFMIIGDDAIYNEKTFAELPDKSFISDNPYTDFALIAQCKAAILSNSTFAWWAATYIPEPICLIAPKNWLAYPDGPEWPEGIISKRFTPC